MAKDINICGPAKSKCMLDVKCNNTFKFFRLKFYKSIAISYFYNLCEKVYDISSLSGYCIKKNLKLIYIMSMVQAY